MSGKERTICPVCGAEVNSAAELCENCGSPMDVVTADIDSKKLEDSLASLEEIVSEEPDSISVCPQCGDFTRPSDITCLTCGYKLKDLPDREPDTTEGVGRGASIADAMFLCPACGAFLTEEARVCDVCGAALSVEKKIGVGDFGTETEEKEEKVCPDCGAFLDEGTGGCPICSGEVGEEEVEPPIEGIDVEDDINKFLEELEATEVSEDATSEMLVEPMKGEVAIEKKEAAIPEAPTPERTARREPVAAEPDSRPVVRRKAPSPALSRMPRERMVQKKRVQVQRVQEFLAYSSLVAIAVYYVSSQAGVDLIHWIMLGVFGVIFGLGLALSLINVPKNWKSTAIRAIPFIAGGAAVMLVPLLHLLSAAEAVYSFDFSIVIAGGLLSLFGIFAMRRDFLIFLIWSAGSLLVFLMAFSALELPTVWGIGGPTAVSLWVFGFLYLVLSVALLIRMKWIRVLIDTEILAGDKKYRERRFRESISSYDKAISASATLKSSADWSDTMDIPWYSKGAALTILGKYEEAIDCIDNALKLSPNNEVALVNKGMALSRLGRHREALKCYNEAIRVNPSYEVAWNNKGNALTRLGKYDEAIKSYERAIHLDEEYKEAWVNKGYVLAKMGDYDGAARCADFVSRFSTPGPPRTSEKLIS